MGFRLPEEQAVIIDFINLLCSYLSAVCTFLVISSTIVMILYDRKLVDRPCLLLNALISVADFIRAIIFIKISYGTIIDDRCSFISFTMVWTMNICCFLTVCIAYHLKNLILIGRSFQNAHVKYFILSLSISFLFAFMPLIAGRYGYDDAQGQCWYKFSYKSESQIWEYATLLIPMAAAILYCTVVFATVAYTLYTASRAFDAHFGQSPVSLDDRPLEDPENQRKTTRDLRRVVGRILIYVLFPLATQLGFVVSEIWMYFNKRISYNLNLWSTPGLALAGLFNFIAFILDPAVNNAFRVIREGIILCYRDETGKWIFPWKNNQVENNSNINPEFIAINENHTSHV